MMFVFCGCFELRFHPADHALCGLCADTAGSPTFIDLREAQPELARGLEQMLTFDGDVESTFCRLELVTILVQFTIVFSCHCSCSLCSGRYGNGTDVSAGLITVVMLACRTFEVEYEYYGEMRKVELCKGGASIAVTNSNRQHYVELYTEWWVATSKTRMICGPWSFL